ncbi:MAG: hypothetical protein SX243_07050 [Acidobacteriota bacterium]|nr:hypothetical protein [Acidobacteriota bacterium]
MQIALYAAAVLLVAIAAAHSYLGEQYILIRLFRRDNLPKLFGGTEFTRLTLRFAWHITSLAWLGFAGVLVLLAHPPADPSRLGLVVGLTFLAHGLLAGVASKGKHLSWIVFLAVGILAIWGT